VGVGRSSKDLFTEYIGHTRKKMATASITDKNEGVTQKISNLCQPCCIEGKQSPAVKYCHDCEELLCSPCLDVHGKLKATRNHRIVDKSLEDTVEL